CPPQLIKNTARVKYMAFSSDGKYLAIAGDHELSVWDWALGEQLFCSLTLWHNTTAISFTPDDRWIVRASDDGCVRFWDREDGHLKCTLVAHAEVIRYMAFDTNGRFTTATPEKAVRVWSYRVGDGKYGPVTLLDLSTSGRYLAIGRGEGTIDVYSVHTMIKVREFPTGEYISCLRVSPNDRFVAACCSGTFRLYDLQTGERSWGPCGNLQCAASVDISPDGRYLVTGGLEHLEVWDLERRRRVHRIPNQWYRIFKVAFTPDGRWIAAASTDGCVRFWDWTTGQLQFILRAHTSEIRAMAFGQDGQFATACADQTVRVW
ncbi:WD40 repeat-like protein, partial [Trichoderma reesei RUT C-30]